jgi:uncharacterized membrane protein
MRKIERISSAADHERLERHASEGGLESSMCHAHEPVWAGLAMPPKGILLETPDQIVRAANEIRVQAVLTTAMPPDNNTQMTQDERRALAAWIATR